jgi:hypothetical protein
MISDMHAITSTQQLLGSTFTKHLKGPANVTPAYDYSFQTRFFFKLRREPLKVRYCGLLPFTSEVNCKHVRRIRLQSHRYFHKNLLQLWPTDQTPILR